jgi:hypothetical protein
VVNTLHTGAQHPRAIKSIGMWGAPTSGKTTYIFGAKDESTELMLSSSRTMYRERRFPDAAEQVSWYSWTVNITTQVQALHRGRSDSRGVVTVPQYSQFNIHLRDAPGGWYGIQQSQGNPTQSRISFGGRNATGGGSPSPVSDIDELTDYLAGCEGLLLLIDPVRELKTGDSHEYFQSTLLRIAQRRLASMPPGSRLPHYVAVCITKFDDPVVYNFARLNGYRTYDEDDPYLFPRVHDDDAESFFKELCGNSAIGDADLICTALARYFHPERIRYFVTSAIGFYREGRFRDDDYRNAVEQHGGSYKIRGQIHPINVLEPVLWLGQKITAARLTIS